MVYRPAMTRGPALVAASLLFVTACGDDGSSATDGPGPTSGPASTSGSATDGGETDPSGPSSDDPSLTDSGSDAATSAPPTGDDTGSADTSPVEPGGGTIDVTLDGCAIDFGGTVVVTYNGSLGVASVYDGGGTLSGSFQFDLSGTGTMELSSQHRVDTGNVINMVELSAGTWTNLDADALTGGIDRIGGTLVVSAWDPAQGVADLELQGVSLLNVVDGSVCTIDGTIVTEELYP